MTAQLRVIAAVDNRLAIGADGQLPWRLPDDLSRFKALTVGRPVLMGRRTAESIGRPLPGRHNLVLSRRRVAPFDGQQVVGSIDEARAVAGDEDLMVIGGGEVYQLALPLASTLHLTHVQTTVDGADAYFPEFVMDDWARTATETHPADAEHAYEFAFVDYTRVGVVG